MRKQFLKDHIFLIIHRFLSLKVLLLIYLLFKNTAYNTFQFEKLFWIWWNVLDTIILWQDVGPCCEQTHAAFEVGLSLDQGQGIYSVWSDVDGSSQLRLCHTCIIDVMANPMATWPWGFMSPTVMVRQCRNNFIEMIKNTNTSRVSFNSSRKGLKPWFLLVHKLITQRGVLRGMGCTQIKYVWHTLLPNASGGNGII